MTEIQNLQAMGAQRMTSLEIAEITGKQQTISQPNGGTRIVPYYSLNKMECLYIATKFNDEARAKLVIRWQQLEQERLMHQGIRHLLVTDQDVMHEAERIVGHELTSDNKHADGCITITDIAKVVGMETKELNS